MKHMLLHYYLTNRCNSKCIFCDIWKEKPKIDAKAIDVISNLRSARQAGCSFVDFTGGEPLLHDELPLFLAEAKKLGFITSVTTNCILFKKRAAELEKLVDLLHFSIDSDNAENHNKIRGVSSYTSVIESIALSKNHGLVPDLLFTYNNSNINELSGVYDIARKNKLILIIDPVFDPWKPDIVSSATHMAAARFAKQKGVYINKAHLALRLSGGNHTRKPVCKAVDSTIVILPDNSIALPCFHHRSVNLKIAGNSFNDIFSSEEYTRGRSNQGKYSFCEGCHINCYFDPSYTFMNNRLTILSIISKMKYAWTKYAVYHHSIPGLHVRKRLLS